MVKLADFGKYSYSGRALVRMLLRHPGVHIQHIFTLSMFHKVHAALYPEFRN